jgi:Mg-chelatase subunit ChlD
VGTEKDFTGDPNWIGVLESSPPNSPDNRLIARYAYNSDASGKELSAAQNESVPTQSNRKQDGFNLDDVPETMRARIAGENNDASFGFYAGADRGSLATPKGEGFGSATRPTAQGFPVLPNEVAPMAGISGQVQGGTGGGGAGSAMIAGGRGEANKAPILGDVPALGALFRSDTGKSTGSDQAGTLIVAAGNIETTKEPDQAGTVAVAGNYNTLSYLGNKYVSEESKPGAIEPEARRIDMAAAEEAKTPSIATSAREAGRPQVPATTPRPVIEPSTGLPIDSTVKLAKKVDAEESAKVREEILPARQLNFSAVDAKQALMVYAQLSGKTILQSSNLPDVPIVLKPGGPRTRGQALREIEAALTTNGIAVISVGEKFVKAVPIAQVQQEGSSGTPPESLDLPVRTPPTNAPIPQPEVQTSENAFSTFSLNVSDVSFKLAAASLEKGQMPDSASIRSEEFINAFDYRDPEPQAGSPIAFTWGRARYPFAHNRDLLRFSLKTAAVGRQAGQPLNIVLLLDNSGSMERADRVNIIREALRVLASQLQAQDRISVITFSRTARLVADGISGDKAGEVLEEVGGLTPEGGTNLEDAMKLAYQTATRHYLANGINRVVVLTDGAANLGNVEPDELRKTVQTYRKQGIALDCFGIGWEGYNDDLLEVLSRNGDGRYGFINSPEEAVTEFAGQLAGALKVAASDVKVQVQFNPRRATAYRQIGYAKHQLTKEQFRDNTVDAAEIAAQEAGNALYTVEVNPSGSGPICTVRVRYKIPGTTDYREQAWDVPYSGNAVSLEQSSPAMRLAGSASAFSEWLAVSPYASEVTLDALLRNLSGVPAVYGADERPKKLEWMIRQAKSLEGK